MTDQPPTTEGAPAPRADPRPFLKQDWPYIAMLILAVVGVALASVAPQQMTPYWEILAPLFAVVCVLARLREAQHQVVLARLIRIEALHWGAVFVAMQLVFVSDVSHMMNADASGLMVMTIVALGTFTAGAQIGAWRICLVGALLALGVPFIAWLEQATLLLVLIGVALLAIAGFYFEHHRRGGANPPQKGAQI